MSWPFSDYLIIPRGRVIVPFFWHVYNEEEWPLGLFFFKIIQLFDSWGHYSSMKNDPGLSTGVIILLYTGLRRSRMRSPNGIQLTYYLIVISTQSNFLRQRSMNYTKSSPETNIREKSKLLQHSTTW